MEDGLLSVFTVFFSMSAHLYIMDIITVIIITCQMEANNSTLMTRDAIAS